jgi:hypothetical protein
MEGIMKLATVGLALALVLGVAACASSSTSNSGSSAASGSALTVADVAPFSGPDAALGPTYLATCYGPPRPSTATAACSGTN